MSELIDFAELETRRDAALLAVEMLSEEMNKIEEMTKSPMSGKMAIAIVTKLAPDLLVKIQERVVGMECTENAMVLKEFNLNSEHSMYRSVFKGIDEVFHGYRDHIEHVFQQVLSNLSSDCNEAGSVFRDIARVRMLADMYTGRQEVRVTDWEAIVPCDNETGDYLMDMAPMQTFKDALGSFVDWSTFNDYQDVWNVGTTLGNVKSRLDILMLLHKRVHSYIPEVPGE